MLKKRHFKKAFTTSMALVLCMALLAVPSVATTDAAPLTDDVSTDVQAAADIDAATEKSDDPDSAENESSNEAAGDGKDEAADTEEAQLAGEAPGIEPDPQKANPGFDVEAALGTVSVSDDEGDFELTFLPELNFNGDTVQFPLVDNTYSFNGGTYVGNSGSISTSNPTDFYMFTATANSLIYYCLDSTASDVWMMLGEVSGSNVTLDPLTGVFSGQVMAAPVTKGKTYALYVTANAVTSTRKSYSCVINNTITANSSNVTGLYAVSNSLSWLMYQTNDGWLWKDGYKLCNLLNGFGDNNHLNYYWKFSGFYSYSVDVTSVKVNPYNISRPAQYRSELGSSDNCVLIDIGPGTIYMFQEWIQGVPGYSSVCYALGKATPLTLNEMELAYAGPNYIVYDYVTGKVVDFVGNLHFAYQFNWYPGPTVQFYS